MDERRPVKLDSVSVAGMAIFGALAVLLTTVSQGLGLNFPVIPYLQFDLGEIAIILSFFIFGPVAAVVSSFIEFLTLMLIGQNVPIGPVLKIVAILSSLLGIWVGTALVSKTDRPTLARMIAASGILGAVFRVVILTFANYYLIVAVFSVSGIVGFLSGTFKAIGISLGGSNAVEVVLLFTAVFNAAQLLLVVFVSSLVLRSAQLKSSKIAGRAPWIVSRTRRAPQP